jgi:hypothetical protein
MESAEVTGTLSGFVAARLGSMRELGVGGFVLVRHRSGWTDNKADPAVLDLSLTEETTVVTRCHSLAAVLPEEVSSVVGSMTVTAKGGDSDVGHVQGQFDVHQTVVVVPVVQFVCGGEIGGGDPGAGELPPTPTEPEEGTVTEGDGASTDTADADGSAEEDDGATADADSTSDEAEEEEETTVE